MAAGTAPCRRVQANAGSVRARSPDLCQRNRMAAHTRQEYVIYFSTCNYGILVTFTR